MHQHIVECSCFVVFRLQGEHIRRLWADGCSLVHAATPSLHAAAPVCTLLHPACTPVHPACTPVHPACTPVHPGARCYTQRSRWCTQVHAGTPWFTPVIPACTPIHPAARSYSGPGSAAALLHLLHLLVYMPIHTPKHTGKATHIWIQPQVHPPALTYPHHLCITQHPQHLNASWNNTAVNYSS